MNKFLLTILTLFCCLASVFSQKKEKIEKVISLWTIDEVTGLVDSVNTSKLDTTLNNFHLNHNPVYKRTIAPSFMANLGSPFQDKIYFNRDKSSEFMFLNSHKLYYSGVEDYYFYNTTTPYADLLYTNGIGGVNQGEDRIKGLFSINVNEKLNIGFKGDFIFGRGRYIEQSTRHVDAGVFASYSGPKYTSYNVISFYNFRNYENGGIEDDRYITNPSALGINSVLKPRNIPVNLADNKALMKGFFIYTNQQYDLGHEKVIKPDSLNPDSLVYEYVPIMKLAVSLKYDHHSRKYESPTVSDFFGVENPYLFSDRTADTVRYQNLKTSFSATLNEEFNRFAKFGITAYIDNEARWYKGYADLDTTKLKRTFEDDFFVGGKIYKKQGKYFRYDVDGRVAVVGTNIGDFNVDGNVWFNIPLKNEYSIHIKAKGDVSLQHASHWMKKYQSNYFVWDNDFKKEFKAGVTGNIAIPKVGFNAFVGFENIKNLLYFNNNALPAQSNGNVQVLQVSLSESYNIKGFGFDVKMNYQLSSNPSLLPLPSWSFYGNIYYTNVLFKVLTFQIGVDIRYHTKYYAPAYMPAIGQFYNQNEVLIGNYPEMNVYLNLHLKRVRVYLSYMNFNKGLFGGSTYFYVPHYPLNPGMFKLGLSWTFYD